MRFCGDNSAYGAETVELSSERRVEAAVRGGDTFPFGVRNLLPVVTSRRKKGGSKVVFALPLAEGVPDEDDPLAHEVVEAAGFLNLLISEARRYAKVKLPDIETIQIGITTKGYSFTRVEEIGPDADGIGAALPIHLRIETSSRPNEPGSTSAVMEFDPDGYVVNVLINCYFEDGLVRRVVAGPDEPGGNVLVQNVYEIETPGAEAKEVYYRWHRPHWAELKYGSRDDRR